VCVCVCGWVGGWMWLQQTRVKAGVTRRYLWSAQVSRLVRQVAVLAGVSEWEGGCRAGKKRGRMVGGRGHEREVTAGGTGLTLMV